MPTAKPAIPDHCVSVFPALLRRRVLAFTTDRRTDFAFAAGSCRFSARQRERLRSRGVPVARVMNIRQVHGRRVRVVREDNAACILGKTGDALVTSLGDVPLAVRTADCLPVFLFAPRRGVIGLVHAGWRGTRLGVTARAVEKLAREGEEDPREIRAAFGPAIRSCCYEVARRFLRYFPGHVKRRGGRYYLDLAAANRAQLTKAGIRPANIYDTGICTCCDKRFFSYRREGRGAGRMISVIMRPLR